MLRNALLLLGLVLLPTSLRAGQLVANWPPVNPGNTLWAEYRTNTSSPWTVIPTRIRDTQFNMSYWPTASSKTPQSFLAYCVDVTHTENMGVKYNVTPAPLSTSNAFPSQLNRDEMGYLFTRYGMQSNAGASNPVNYIHDSALQLALWDLSLSPVTGSNKFVDSGVKDKSGADFYVDSNFGFGIDATYDGTPTPYIKAVDQRAELLKEANGYLSEAYSVVSASKDPDLYASTVELLQNVPNSTSPQQAVLAPGPSFGLPEPSTAALALCFAATLGCYRAVRGRRQHRMPLL